MSWKLPIELKLLCSKTAEPQTIPAQAAFRCSPTSPAITLGPPNRPLHRSARSFRTPKARGTGKQTHDMQKRETGMLQA